MNLQEKIFALKISLIMATRMLGLFMIFPIFSLYADEYSGSTPFLIGMALGVYGLTQALLQIPFGYMSDRFGRKPLLLFGILIFILGSVLAAYSTDIIYIILARTLQGAGAISAVLMAFLADYVREEHRTSANAFVGVQIGMAFMVAIIAGPIIASSYGIDGVFWAITILAGAGMLVALGLPHVAPKTLYPFSRVHMGDVMTKKLLKIDYSIFSLHSILAATFVSLPVLLSQSGVIDVVDSWQLYLPVMIVAFIFMVPLIILAHKDGRSDMMLAVNMGIIIISQMAFFVMPFSFYTALTVLIVFFSAFNALEATLPSLVSKNAPGEKRGLAMGFFATSQFLGAFVGGFGGGIMYASFGLESVFIFNSVIGITGLYFI
jgi:MFS family permease